MKKTENNQLHNTPFYSMHELFVTHITIENILMMALGKNI